MSTIEAVVKVVFLVPRTLTWDKLCALYLQVLLHCPNRRFGSFSEVMQAGVADICFDGENRPEKFVDVDVIRDYKRSGHGSATERVAQEHGLLDLPGVSHLLQLLNKNNSNGFLKSFPESFVWLIREFFNVGAENPSRDRRIKVIDTMWPAVEMYFAACEVDEAAVTAMKNPFTVESFEKLCDIAQVGEMQIVYWVSRYQSMFASAKKQGVVAQQRALDIVPETFTVTGSVPGVGHVIESDNTRVAGQYLRENPDVAILMVRRRNGNVAIFCTGRQNFNALHAELERLEPSVWYLETRNPSPMLLNGSTSREAAPTKLSKKMLVELIQSNHRHTPRH